MKEIFELQYGLNKYTLSKIGIDYDKVVSCEDNILSGTWMNNYRIAYLAELSELIVEAKQNNYEVTHNLKIEIVDLLHFIVSMSHIVGIDPVKNLYADIPQFFPSNDYTHYEKLSFLNKIIVSTFVCADTIMNNSIMWKWWSKGSKEKFNKIICKNSVLSLWVDYYKICSLFKMSFDEMKRAYIAKNKVNFDRQNNNYNIDTKTEEDNINLKF